MSSVLKVDEIQNTAGTSALTIDSNGVVTTPSTSRPAFHVQLSSSINSTVAAAGVVFDEASLNQGSHYSTSTGRFTAPVAGLYWFSVRCLTDMDGTDGYAAINITKNGSVYARDQTYSLEDNDHSGGTSLVMYLAANDYIAVTANRGLYGASGGSANYTHFSGYLIG